MDHDTGQKAAMAFIKAFGEMEERGIRHLALQGVWHNVVVRVTSSFETPAEAAKVLRRQASSLKHIRTRQRRNPPSGPMTDQSQGDWSMESLMLASDTVGKFLKAGHVEETLAGRGRQFADSCDSVSWSMLVGTWGAEHVMSALKTQALSFEKGDYRIAIPKEPKRLRNDYTVVFDKKIEI